MSKRLRRLFPASKRDWAEAMVTEFGSTRGVGRLLLTAWYLELKGALSVRTVLMTLSVMCLLAAAMLTVLWLADWPGPVEVPVLAAALALQGGFTAWFLSGSRFEVARQLLLIGETVALLVGAGGLLVATVNNIGAADHEYGPIAVAGLIGAHAAATLYVYAIRGDTVPMDASADQ